MVSVQSVDQYLRVIHERFGIFKESLHNFKVIIACENREEKRKSANNVLAALDPLKAILSKSDQPNWIPPLETALKRYIAHIDRVDAIIGMQDAVINAVSAVARQKWGDIKDDVLIDFGAIYRAEHAASALPTLFDQLISQLEQIVNSGAVDSIKTINSLEKLIAMARKTAGGDYLTTQGTLGFANVLFRNVGMEMLEKAPIVGPMVKGVRKTLEQLNLEAKQVFNHFNQKAQAAIRENLPMFGYDEPSSSAGHELPIGETPAIDVSGDN
jgi:hypothetical protein